MPKVLFRDFMERLNRDILKEYYFDESSYNGISFPIKITHKTCGNKFEMVAKNFLNGQRCPKCTQIIRNNSLVKIDEELLKNIEGKYELIKYNGKTKVNEFKCLKCGYEITSTNKFIKNLKCPNCYLEKTTKINKNINKYQNTIDELGFDIEILPEYFYSTIKLSKFKCKKCNNYFLGYYNNFIVNNKSTCPFCNTIKKDITPYKIKLKEMKLDDKYEILSDSYETTTKTLVKFHCFECGNDFEKRLADFFSNNQYCPICAKTKNKIPSKREINEKIKDKNLILYGKYVNRITPTEFKCTICGNIVKNKLKYIIEGNAIPCFNCFQQNTKYHSKFAGEQKIIDTLKKLKINDFVIHYRGFKDLFDKEESHPLEFDFYIESLNTVIEFNGIQHYKINDFFGGEEYFKSITKHDKLKENYCKNNNIKEIVIKYDEFDDIYDILKNELS